MEPRWYENGDLDCPNGVTISAEHPNYGETTIAKVTFAHPDVDDRSYCTPDEAKSNAAFIVRACNAHDDLVRLLRLAVDLRETENRSGDIVNWPKWEAEARAALEAAEKGQ